MVPSPNPPSLPMRYSPNPTRANRPQNTEPSYLEPIIMGDHRYEKPVCLLM